MSTNMTLITSVTVGSGGAASVTLPATGTIPATYTDLKVMISARNSYADNNDWINIQFNSSTTGYSYRLLQGGGGIAASYSGTTQYAGDIDSANATANTFGNYEIYIPNYTSSNNKSWSVDCVTENNSSVAVVQDLVAGLWSNSAAITTITFSPRNGSFVEGSTFYLYGISNVTSTTKATGGIVSSDGTYNYHMFPYSGTFTPTQNITADYLVIAGGGGGGKLDGGGGGAGGLRSTVGATGGGGSLESALSLTANTAYTVTVGAGGAGSTSISSKGTNGSNSVFSSITSTGGGGGGSHHLSEAGATGGSGGGGSHGNPTVGAGGAGTTNQGYAGGSGYLGGGGINAGGGGGGAGETGNTDGKSEGGDGVAISAFANATQTGVNTYYAGGGGAGMENGIGGPEGLGGGGHGSYNDSGAGGTAGITNTGGGGGGGGYSSSGGNGFAGGSGLVIIRYAI